MNYITELTETNTHIILIIFNRYSQSQFINNMARVDDIFLFIS
jgi:hypothetical protein